MTAGSSSTGVKKSEYGLLCDIDILMLAEGVMEYELLLDTLLF